MDNANSTAYGSYAGPNDDLPYRPEQDSAAESLPDDYDHEVSGRETRHENRDTYYTPRGQAVSANTTRPITREQRGKDSQEFIKKQKSERFIDMLNGQSVLSARLRPSLPTFAVSHDWLPYDQSLVDAESVYSGKSSAIIMPDLDKMKEDLVLALQMVDTKIDIIKDGQTQRSLLFDATRRRFIKLAPLGMSKRRPYSETLPVVKLEVGHQDSYDYINRSMCSPPHPGRQEKLLRHLRPRYEEFLNNHRPALDAPLSSRLLLREDQIYERKLLEEKIEPALRFVDECTRKGSLDFFIGFCQILFLRSWKIKRASLEPVFEFFSYDANLLRTMDLLVPALNLSYTFIIVVQTFAYVSSIVAFGSLLNVTDVNDRACRLRQWEGYLNGATLQTPLDLCSIVVDSDRLLDDPNDSSWGKHVGVCLARLADDILLYQVEASPSIECFSLWIFRNFKLIMNDKFLSDKINFTSAPPLRQDYVDCGLEERFGSREEPLSSEESDTESEESDTEWEEGRE